MEIEETTDAEAPEARLEPQPPRQHPKQRPPQRERERVDENFNEWVGSLSGGAKDYKVKIERTDPQHDDAGNQVGGWLAELEDFSEVDEMYLRNRWGGGRFVIHVFQRHASGKWLMARRFPVKIAGAPKSLGGAKIEALPSVARDENPRLQEKAMDHSMRLAQAERERADRLEQEVRKAGEVPAWVLELLNEERRQKTVLEQRIADILSKLNEPKRDETPKYLELMMVQSGQQTAQTAERHRSEIEAMARNHEAQMRAANDAHQRQLDSMREEHKRTLDQLQRSNDLVVSTMTTTHQGQMSATTIAHQGQVNLLTAQLEGLKNERDDLKRRLEKLQDEKKKGPTEMIEEIGRLKEGLEALGMTGDEGKDTWEKVMDKVGDVVSPFTKALARRPAGAPMMAPPPGMVPQGPPPGVPQGAAPPMVAPPPGFDPDDIPKLIQFVESAIGAQQKPEVFARAAGSMVPTYLLEAFASDPDAFASEVVRVAPGSIIGTPRGRLFLRKVAGYLLSGGEKPEVATA